MDIASAGPGALSSITPAELVPWVTLDRIPQVSHIPPPRTLGTPNSSFSVRPPSSHPIPSALQDTAPTPRLPAAGVGEWGGSTVADNTPFRG